ncbi:fibronectin type III domain-containing protein [Kribbella sp. NPDC058245]|uniref:fibronectin type III domain-containing protein n=1 Tax=Kribbella sp. NPDC058245 TaxID=3346399 RepID=UPI0036E8E1F2
MRRFCGLLVVLSLILSGLVAGPAQAVSTGREGPPAPAIGGASATSGRGQYVPLAAPKRVLDTGAATLVAAGKTVTTALGGRNGLPASGMSGVMANIIVMTASANGSLPTWAVGDPEPAVWTMQFKSTQTYGSTSSLIRTNSTGQFNFKNNSTGTIRVLIDVFGYYTDDTVPVAASRFVPLKQTRIVDTRTGLGGVPVGTAPTDKSLTFAVAGKGGLPAVGAISAVAVNVTAWMPAAAGTWVVHPAGAAVPVVSNGSYNVKRPLTSSAIAVLSANGQLGLYGGKGASHFTIDVVGYYTPSSNTGAASMRVTAAKPVRVLDTGTTLIAAGGSKTLHVAGVAEVPQGVGAVALHLMASGTATSGELITYPTGQAKPTPATDVVYAPDPYSYNLVWARVSATGDVTITNGTSAPARIYGELQGYAVSPQAPGTPTAVKATPSNAGASVAWSAPDDDGDLTIANYRVSITPGGRTVTATSTTAVIDGLTNGRQYTFRVTAMNAAGPSAASASSPAVTPRLPAPPGKPFITSSTPRHASAAVSWSPPTGADSIVSYKVTATPGGTSVTTAGTARSVVLTGLTNDTYYDIVVTAVNGNGSAESTPVPVRPRPAEVPMAPMINAVTELDGRVDVQWVHPPDGGGDITGYELEASPGNIVQSIAPDTTVAAVRGLANGTAYTFKVRAKNIAGDGPQATSTATPIAERAPDVPSSINVAAGAPGTLAVNWRAPADTGTSAITGYTVKVSPGGRTIDVTATSASVAGLDPETEYTLTVAAKNATGTGAASTPTSPIRPRVAIKKTPVVLSPASLAAISEMSSDGAIAIERPTPQLAAIVVGDIVVGESSAVAPLGFMKKVVRIDSYAGMRVLLTEDAPLTDVLSEGELFMRGEMLDEDVASFEPAMPGIRLRESTIRGKTLRQGGAESRLAPAGDWTIGMRNGAFMIEMENSFGGVEGKVSEGFDLRLTAMLKPFWDGKLETGSRRADLQLGVETTMQFKAFLKARGGGFDKPFTLGKLRGVCLRFMIGVVPIQVCPEAKLKLRIEASGKASILIDGEFGQRVGVNIFSAPGSVGGEPFESQLKPGFLRVTPSLQAEGRVTLENALGLVFNGLGGPEITLSPYIEGEVNLGAEPWAEATIGLTMDAGLNFNAFGIKQEWTKKKILDIEIKHWETSGPFNGIVLDPPTAQILGGESVQIRGSISAHPDEPISRWRLGEHSVGSITSNGLFSAPPGTNGDAKVIAEVDATVTHPKFVADMTVRVGVRRPDAVTDVRVAPADLGATISWKAPGQNGGTPLTQYVVTTDPDTGARYVPAGKTSVTLGGLSDGKTYTASVRAVNAVGIADPVMSEDFVVRRAIVSDFSATDISRGLGEPALGLDLQAGRSDIGLYYAAVSETGRYAFFNVPGMDWITAVPGLPYDGQQYLVRRDLYTGEYELASKAEDGITPQPIVSAPYYYNKTLPNAGDGRYVAYQVMAGTSQVRIFVHDLTTGATWTSGAPVDNVAAIRLTPSGSYLAYVVQRTGSSGEMINEIYRASPSGRVRVDTCPGQPTCRWDPFGRLGMSADGNTVMYSATPIDPAHPNNGRAVWVFKNVSAGSFTLPYATMKDGILDMNFSDDGTGMLAVGIDSATFDFYDVAKPAGQPFTIADALETENPLSVYNGGEVSSGAKKVAMLRELTEDERRLYVYDVASRQKIEVPGPIVDTPYEDFAIDLSDDGSLVSWGRFDDAGGRCGFGCNGVQAMRVS